MTLQEIHRRGLELGWTREQARYLTDIVRNSLVPFKAQTKPRSQVTKAVEKLEVMIGAVVHVGYGTKRPDPAADTVCICCGALPCTCGSQGRLTQELAAQASVAIVAGTKQQR